MDINMSELNTQEQELSELLQIRREKLRILQDEGRDPFKVTKFHRSVFTSDIINNYETMENTEVTLAGRVMAKREMGKAVFVLNTTPAMPMISPISPLLISLNSKSPTFFAFIYT